MPRWPTFALDLLGAVRDLAGGHLQVGAVGPYHVTEMLAAFNERFYFYNPGSSISTVTTTYSVYDPSTKTYTTVTKTDSVASGATVSRSVNSDVGSDRMVSFDGRRAIVVPAGAPLLSDAVDLPVKALDRLVISSRYFLELSGEETAAALGIPEGTVKSRLSRALTRLRALFEGSTNG